MQTPGRVRIERVHFVAVGLDDIIRNHFFDLVASVVLPGPKDVTWSTSQNIA